MLSSQCRSSLSSCRSLLYRFLSCRSLLYRFLSCQSLLYRFPLCQSLLYQSLSCPQVGHCWACDTTRELPRVCHLTDRTSR